MLNKHYMISLILFGNLAISVPDKAVILNRNESDSVAPEGIVGMFTVRSIGGDVVCEVPKVLVNNMESLQQVLTKVAPQGRHQFLHEHSPLTDELLSTLVGQEGNTEITCVVERIFRPEMLDFIQNAFGLGQIGKFPDRKSMCISISHEDANQVSLGFKLSVLSQTYPFNTEHLFKQVGNVNPIPTHIFELQVAFDKGKMKVMTSHSDCPSSLITLLSTLLPNGTFMLLIRTEEDRSMNILISPTVYFLPANKIDSEMQASMPDDGSMPNWTVHGITWEEYCALIEAILTHLQCEP